MTLSIVVNGDNITAIRQGLTKLIATMMKDPNRVFTHGVSFQDSRFHAIAGGIRKEQDHEGE